jgi:hypothetical protein
MFQRVKQLVNGILCVTNNKKYKLDLIEIPHLLQPCCEPQYCIAFVLTRAIVENNIVGDSVSKLVRGFE